MPERHQDIESFGDSQVQALFDKFLAVPEPLLDTGDLLTQRALAEVKVVYGTGGQVLSPTGRLLQRVGVAWRLPPAGCRHRVQFGRGRGVAGVLRSTLQCHSRTGLNRSHGPQR